MGEQKQERMTCGCGRWVVSYRDTDGRKLAKGEWVRENPGRALRVLGAYCHECAEAMVPRAALEIAYTGDWAANWEDRSGWGLATQEEMIDAVLLTLEQKKTEAESDG